MCIPIGHHPYIAHYFGLDSRMAFTKKVADVYSFTTGVTTTYQLEIPFHPQMPLLNGLFSKKAIRWYLRHGFVPTLLGRKITFVKESNDRLNGILSLCDQVASEYHIEPFNPMDDLEESFATIDLEEEVLYEAIPPKPTVDNTELIKQLIIDFKENIERGKQGFALECIQMAYELDPHSSALKELYAEYLLSIKDVRAARLFVELSQTKGRINPVAFLEKALASDPANEELIVQLQRVTSSRPRILNQCLYAFLHSWKIDQVKAEAFYKKALSINPQEPFIFLSRLSCMSSKQQKEGLFRTLADIFRRRQSEQIAKYYLGKIPGGLQQYISEAPRKKVDKPKPLVVAKPIRSKSCPKLSAFLIHEPGIDGFIDDAEIAVKVGKEAKNDYLDLIDQHIKRGENRQAEEAIAQAKSRCGDTGSLLKRQYKVCSDIDQVDDILWQLWGVYTQKAKVNKAEVVARLMDEFSQDFESGWRVATCLATQGKARMSAQRYYALAKSSLQLSDYDALGKCLEKIEALDPTYASFVPIERTGIYLLHLASRISKKEGFTVDLTTEKLAFSLGKKPLKASAQVTGFRCVPYEGNIAFAVDHPEYVACWSNWEQRVLFTKSSAEVFSCRTGKKTTLALHLPGSEDMLDDIALFEHKTIQWYLQEGFVPVEQDGVMTFVLRSKAVLTGALAQQLQSCIAFYLYNDPNLHQQLQKVRCCFENEQHSLAIAQLQKIKDTRVKKLYAEYLAFCKSPKAHSLFLELSRETKGDESCAFLEKAFLLEPHHEWLYERIVERSPTKARALTLCLFAYTHLIKIHPVKASLFYAKALKLDPNDSFMHFAFLETIPKGDKVQKMKAYAGVVDVFQQKDICEYYSRKKQLINSIATLEGAKKLISYEWAKTVETVPDFERCTDLLEKFCAQVLDLLLEEQAYEMAEEAVVFMLQLFQQRCPVSIYAKMIGEDDERYYREGDLFLLREIEIYSHLGSLDKLKEVLNRLGQLYQNTATKKACIIGRLKHERARDLTGGNLLASLYLSQGMKQEAVEVYLETAFWCILQKFFVNAEICVKRAREVDLDGIITTNDEKAMMRIIESIAKLPAVLYRI